MKEQDSDEDSDRSTIFLGAMRENVQDNNEFSFRAYVKEFSRQVDFIIDIGADVTCISTNSIPDKLKKEISKTSRIIIGPDGRKLSVEGSVHINIEKRSTSVRSKVYVLNGLKQNLLEKSEIKKFKLVNW